MPLLDHFHPPLAPLRHWESFHATWAGALADALNRQLPANYFAEEQAHAGARIEIDVATYEGRAGTSSAGSSSDVATVAEPQLWAPPAPALTMPSVRPDQFEVLVFHDEGGARLVAAIELVSPGNKDRPEQRRAFAAKCASYLYQGVSLVILDIVTIRQANLHNEVVRLMEQAEPFLLPGDNALYAVAYHPVRRDGAEQIDLWPASLAVGQALPVLPLALTADQFLPVDLEATYTDACRRRRLT